MRDDKRLWLSCLSYGLPGSCGNEGIEMGASYLPCRRAGHTGTADIPGKQSAWLD
jgi:hypothetical protein